MNEVQRTPPPRRRMLRRRLIPALAAVVAVGLLAANLTMWIASWHRIYGATDLESLPHFNAAVVLGCAKRTLSGGINRYFRTRTEAAAALYHARRVSCILVSGDNGRTEYDEASDMKDALVALGVPPERIVCDYAGFRTLDTVLRTDRVFGQKRFLLVSQRFHLERAIFLARAHGIDAYGYEAEPVRGRIAVRTTIREQPARAVALLDILIHRRPRFYGDPVPLPVVESPSPNFGERKAPISLVVLHYTSIPTVDRSLAVLCDPDRPNPVSAHYVVAPDGRIHWLVDETKRAWHAGVGSWGNVTNDVNSASIGIEIVNEGLDEDGNPVPYPPEQIDAVLGLCRDLAAHYPIQSFIGHSDCAPGRKIDPGPLFPWEKLEAAGLPVRKLEGGD